MVNYKNGKIYKILDLTNDNFYIGSTTKMYLSQRLEKHRTQYKDYLKGIGRCVSSYKIISNKNYKIYLLENAPCVSKDELRMREQYWLDRLNCIKLVNKNRAFRTEQNKKEYYENNKKIVLEKQKEYYENNKEKIAEKHKEYYEKNKEKIAETKKQYREKNKEKIAEKKKENVQCSRCNAIVRKYYLKKHQQNKTCINALPHGLICELAD